jgi:hypothetical protein
LGDVNVLEIQADALRDPLLVHQARHVRRNYVFGTVPKMIMNLIQAHPCGDGLIRYAERATESTTIIRPIYGNKDQALDFRKQRCRLVEWFPHDFGWLRDSEAPDGAAAIVQSDGVLKLRPWEGVDLQNIVEELDEFIGTLANMLDFVRLFDSVEMASNLFDAAPSRPDDVIERGEILHKEMLSSSSVGLVAAIRHGLSAAGLVEREAHIETESLQKLQGRNSDLRKDHVDIAGYKEADPLVHGEHSLSGCFGLRCHVDSPFGLGITLPSPRCWCGFSIRVSS